MSRHCYRPPEADEHVEIVPLLFGRARIVIAVADGSGYRDMW